MMVDEDGNRTPCQVRPKTAFLLRVPVKLYDWGVGWLLGRRFLLLTHVGRRSGRHHRTVLEVIRYLDDADEYVVISGLGRGADWYRNICATPPVEVTVGRRRFVPDCRVLDEDRALDVLASYEQRHRWSRRVMRVVLTKLVGWRYDGGVAAQRLLVRQLPMVGLRPRDPSAVAAVPATIEARPPIAGAARDQASSPADRNINRGAALVGAGLLALGLTLTGLVAGLAAGLATDAHVEIAGTEAAVRIHLGRTYDRLDLNGVLSARRAAGRSLVGEPIGISVHLQLDPSTLIGPDGAFDTNVLPAYIQAYSDPSQIATDLRWGVTKHLLWFGGAGAALGMLIFLAGWRYRRWRRKQDSRTPRAREMRRMARAYRSRERAFGRHAAVVVAVLALITVIPSGLRHVDPPARIVPDPILADTPLAGTQVGGLLRPAIQAAKNYIQTYFADTNSYYDSLRDKLTNQLDADALTLPAGDDVVNVGFVTDRHCNIGMDRVIVALLKHFKITTLVSGGDDAFSGSFSFESACTKNLASKSQQAGISDVFVAGNHDSAMTINDERRQGIKVLDGPPVKVDGLTFAGLPDPRSSRYGQGIKPDSAAKRAQLIAQQGQQVGRLACQAGGPVIVVLHDPRAGDAALQNGCGKAVTALDGHTHKQAGPTPVPLPNGTSGYQFVGGSTGGAPGEGAVERTFASRLTVGPLNHNASLNIVSIDRKTGEVVAVSECAFTPDQTITFQQQVTG